MTVRKRQISVYQVDAFTNEPFRGNPAAVCLTEKALPDELMQAIAAEMNLSETAFIIPREEPGHYGLRWFTPTVEVPLCGHATLASGWVLLRELHPELEAVVFETASGPLTVTRKEGRLQMDFPAYALSPTDELRDELREILGVAPQAVLGGRGLMAVLASSEAVRSLKVDAQGMMAAGVGHLSVTALGDGVDGDVDFVSRFFAPGSGIDEDPVTGSAHCRLAPYWTARLGRSTLRARQVSRRGGDLVCELRGDRVLLSGEAVLVLRGTLSI